MEVRELLEALVVEGEIRVRIDVYHHHLVEIPPPPPAAIVIQTPGQPRPNGKEPPPMTDFVLQDDQEVVVTIAPGDVVANPIPGAVFDASSVTVTSAVETALTVELAADQSGYTATAVGPEETGVAVTVKGTVGGAECTSTLTFDITASPAATVLQTPGIPTTIPADVPPPPPPAVVALDPATSKPLYLFEGTPPIDVTLWTAVSDVAATTQATPDSGLTVETLYIFDGDVPNGPATGASAEWVPYTGTPTPVPAAPVDTTNPTPPAAG